MWSSTLPPSAREKSKTAMRRSLPVYSLAAAMLVSAALAWPAEAQDTSSRMKGLELSNDKPIQIESDNLEIREQEKKALFDGNVKVAQGQMTLQSNHMTVY